MNKIHPWQFFWQCIQKRFWYNFRYCAGIFASILIGSIIWLVSIRNNIMFYFEPLYYWCLFYLHEPALNCIQLLFIENTPASVVLQMRLPAKSYLDKKKLFNYLYMIRAAAWKFHPGRQDQIFKLWVNSLWFVEKYTEKFDCAWFYQNSTIKSNSMHL